MSKNDIVKAQQRFHAAVRTQQQSLDTLEKSIAKLEDTLTALGVELEAVGQTE